jgi:nitrogen fixation-related uncharacterized protein
MREPTKLLLHILRYALLSIFSIVGVYYFLWSVQSASFSVPAEPIMSEIYKTRAAFYLPVSILMFAVGGLLFISLRTFSNDRSSA